MYCSGARRGLSPRLERPRHVLPCPTARASCAAFGGAGAGAVERPCGAGGTLARYITHERTILRLDIHLNSSFLSILPVCFALYTPTIYAGTTPPLFQSAGDHSMALISIPLNRCEHCLARRWRLLDPAHSQPPSTCFLGILEEDILNIFSVSSSKHIKITLEISSRCILHVFLEYMRKKS